MSGKRLLRDMKLGGRAREAARPGDRCEVLHREEIHGSSRRPAEKAALLEFFVFYAK
jgi:hypothetical protein